MDIQDLEQIDYSQRANIRCVPKSLVQVVNLPSYLGDQALLSKQLFGRYGKIKKIIVKQVPIQNTCQAYVTYQTEQQALDCIYSLNETYFDNHLIKCQRGTSKFCNSALAGKECTNPNCQYIHSISEQVFIHNSQDNQCKIKFNEVVHPDRFQAKLPQGHQHIQNKITYEDNQSQAECFPPSYLQIQTSMQESQLNQKNQIKCDKRKLLELFGGYMIGDMVVV